MKFNFPIASLSRGAIMLFSAGCLLFSSVQSLAQPCPTITPATATLCPSSYTATFSLIHPTSGAWSILDGTSPLTINSSGVVTGTSGGTATITFTPSVGLCPPVYATATSSAISGPSIFCSSAGSVTLLNSIGAGTWSTGTTALASIGAGTGILTYGTGSGVSNVTYTLPAGVCAVGPVDVYYNVTVDDNPVVTLTSPTSTSVPQCTPGSIHLDLQVNGGVAPYNCMYGCVGCTSTSNHYGVPAGGPPTDVYDDINAPAGSLSYDAYVVDAAGCQSNNPSVGTFTVNQTPSPSYYYGIHYPPCSTCYGPWLPPLPGVPEDMEIILGAPEVGVNYTFNPTSASETATSTAAIHFHNWAAPHGTYANGIIGFPSSTFTADNGLCSITWGSAYPYCKQAVHPTINPALAVEGLSLTPNPNSGEFTIAGGADFMLNALIVKMEITDVVGRLVLTGNMAVTNGTVDRKVEMPDDISAGVYQVKLSTSSGSQVLRLQVNK